MLTRCLLLVLPLGASLSMAGSGSRADEPKIVSLILSKASAERTEHDTIFTCEAKMDNATGQELTARSSFTSVLFDGLELVVTNKEGKVLVQHPYTFHQSPFSAQGITATLKKGITPKTLTFPIRDFPRDLKVVKVRLVGTLPGSEYTRILSTETLEVRIKE